MEKISNRESYLKSISDRNLKIYLMGKLVEDPLSHPIIRPSIEAMAETYELAVNEPELGSVKSPYTGESINRFLHIAESNDDLYLQNKMQRKLGQLTGTCFQRCVGMDAFNALHSVTFEIDEKYSTKYHQNFISFLTEMHKYNLVIGGAMTDVKGDRSKLPHEQEDEDLYLRIVDRDENGVYVKGAKAHQTGCINSHWMVVMPTLRLTEKDKDYAIVGAIPVDAEGITYIYGRQSCDTRSMEPGEYDVGNKYFAGQEAMVIFDNVFIPNELIFMNGEFDFASMLVERFTTYHRRSYVCKAGVGDVLIGAAATIAEYNGVENASHISDKLVEMNKMNETIYATGIASSLQGSKTKSGNYINDDLLANVCKQHVTKDTFEIGRLAQDLAGGLVGSMPSGIDFNEGEMSSELKKYLKGIKETNAEDRVKILRLIENMTLGRNAVAYLTESLHGAGSPQAQRVQIKRKVNIEEKKDLAKKLSGVNKKDKN
ncbi:MAG: 4-hydroxybutyryl-CoA dehydratase [Candidatus Actinomarinales bacterium]|jgi:4-hydroxybutyryl-CoA dehydratase/vinylacetyl-CoA-Delta-isomerase|nr:4-hydroxybutyryl-CoA dehydratase [Candidatus Actinomarinales bacterium]